MMKTPLEIYVKQKKEIDQLEYNLNWEELDKFISVLSKALGHVVVSGIGKTGLIGRLFSSGLNSIGVHSSFIQASEASHGDLGILRSKDIVFIISKSGQSIEFYPVIDYCLANNIKLMAMTSNKESYLAYKANYLLLVPKMEEMPPVDILPSTSNILFIILCELLKVNIATIRGFTNTMFVKTHPGGRIGNKNLSIDHLMRTGNLLPIIDEDYILKDALLVMTKKLCGCVLITREDELIGIITDGDIRRALQFDSGAFVDKRVIDIMNTNPITIDEKATIEEAEIIFAQKSVSQLVVIDKNSLPKKIKGMVHFMDVNRQNFERYDITNIRT